MITLIFLVVIVIVVIRFSKPPSEAVGHWNHMFADMEQDSEEFYVLVEEILEDREIPDINTKRRIFKQGGVLSHQRLYLEVSRKDYIFHICAAPWGTGFFVSWWIREKLSDLDEILIKIPFIGPPIVKARQYKSYYKLDTDTMFRSSVHQSILGAIDGLTKAKGIRELSELERKPDLRAIIK